MEAAEADGLSQAVPPPHSSRLAYRKDIDGLRAVAVLSAIVFHAFPPVLPGGFIGVEIFFVISGFLISGILYGELERGEFSFAGFYRRRIRRIFPSLAVVLAFCLLFGYLVLFPDEYWQLGRDIAWGAGFMANFAFWGETGYFDHAAYTKPLLHLWSLGVEEQFYIIWPAILWTAWRNRQNLLGVMLGLAGVSFVLNLNLSYSSPDAAFYAPHTRFWELMAGSALGYVNLRFPTSCARIPANALSLIGAALIAFSLLRITGDMPVGPWLVLPVMGTVLIIAAGDDAWLNRKLLSHPLLVAVGIVSYPLYLWHWPLLSFARIAGGDVDWQTRALLVALSGYLAMLTYTYVEKPLRKGGNDRGKITGLLLAMLALAAAGMFVSRPTDWSKPPETLDLAAFNQKQLGWNVEPTPEECKRRAGGPLAGFCNIVGNAKHVTVALIGDSTSNSLAPGLGYMYGRHGTGVISFWSVGCPPIRGVNADLLWGKHSEGDCMHTTDAAYRTILNDPTIKTVILSLFSGDLRRWRVSGTTPNAVLKDREAALAPMIERDISDLLAHGKDVVVSYDMPSLPVEPRDCVARMTQHTAARCDGSEAWLKEEAVYSSFFEALLGGRHDICIFRQSGLLVKGGKLKIFDDDGKLLLRDKHHLSYWGSEKMGLLFEKSACYRH